ncbi:ABC transporter substrate-binding protein [Motilibacter peucedani]|nr:sugar ABC transporter substrate-binding protein [Motilibacter peucedani]
MSIRQRRAVATAVLATSVTVLSACGSGSTASNGASADTFKGKPTGTLNAWAFDNADDVGKARLDYAKGQLGGLDIKLDQTAFDAQKFTTRIASGNVPDVVQMNSQFVATYAAQGLITPVDQCLSTHSVTATDHWYPQVVDDVKYDGKIWAVPQFYQPPAIILNKRVMDAAGVTAADIDTSKPEALIAAAKKMTKASGGNPTTMGFNPVPTGQPGLWLLAFGGKLIGDQGKPALDDPKNAQALTFLKQLVDAQGGWAKIKSFTDSFDVFGDKNQFVKDQVGAEVDAQWYVNVLTPYVKQVDISAVPLKDSSGQPVTAASGTAFVIPAGAKNPAAACAWMLDLTSDAGWMAAGAARAATLKAKPGAINTGLFTGSPSADKSIRSTYVKPSGNAGFDQTINTYYSILPTGKSFGSSPAGQQIQTEITNAIASALLGEKSPADALKAAQDASMQAYTKVVK